MSKVNSIQENSFTKQTRLEQESTHQSTMELDNTSLSSDIIPRYEHNNNIIPTEDDDFGSFGGEEEDEFGNFDSDDNAFDEEFGSFDDFDTRPVEPMIITFDTLEETLDAWKNLLQQIYDIKPIENFTRNASKSIKYYVLEEASDSLHSRITWDSVTRHMDNDTGIPKVRWYQSEIENLHLNALSCKRTVKPPEPKMLDTVDHKPEPIDTTIWSNNLPSPVIETATQTTPTSEKRSSIFGLSSLSRYLPHLSKTNLPKSPTSPVSSNLFYSIDNTTHEQSSSNSTLRRSNTTTPDSKNHMNIQTKLSTLNSNTIKRSNTVAFSTRFKSSSPILDLSSSPPSITTKTRPTSFHNNIDLFDFDIDPNTIIKSPTSIEFNTKPLIPNSPTTHKITLLQPTVISNVINNNSTVQNEDLFDDFFTTKKAPPVKNISKNDDDPFGLNSVMQMSASNIKAKPESPTKKVTLDYDAKISAMFDIPTVNDQTEEEDWGDWTF